MGGSCSNEYKILVTNLKREEHLGVNGRIILILERILEK
jgi:hypothetical protein